MYKYSEDKGANDPSFYFYTEFGLSYYVSFRNMSQDNFPLNNLYSLDFGEVNNLKGRKDMKISSTILNIIIDFLNSDKSIIIHFLCDSEDLRQLNRKRLFNRWFSICGMDNWVKYDYDFDSVDYNISFLYCSEVYDTSLVESEILLSLDALERVKNQ